MKANTKDYYMPLVIGEWERDVNVISLCAEGALLKLSFKLWDAKPRGSIDISYQAMAKLFKMGEPEARRLFDELRLNNILNVLDINDQMVRISSRRMLKKTVVSETNSENGRKGGKGKKASTEVKANLKRSETETLTIDMTIAINNLDKIELPFDSEKFADAFMLLLSSKEWRKKKLSTVNNILKKLGKYEEEFAIILVEQATDYEWIGVIFADTPRKYQEWLSSQKGKVSGRLNNQYNDVASQL